MYVRSFYKSNDFCFHGNDAVRFKNKELAPSSEKHFKRCRMWCQESSLSRAAASVTCFLNQTELLFSTYNHFCQTFPWADFLISSAIAGMSVSLIWPIMAFPTNTSTIWSLLKSNQSWWYSTPRLVTSPTALTSSRRPVLNRVTRWSSVILELVRI